MTQPESLPNEEPIEEQPEETRELGDSEVTCEQILTMAFEGHNAIDDLKEWSRKTANDIREGAVPCSDRDPERVRELVETLFFRIEHGDLDRARQP